MDKSVYFVIFGLSGLLIIGAFAGVSPGFLAFFAALYVGLAICIFILVRDKTPFSPVETGDTSKTYDPAAGIADSFNEAVITVNPDRRIIFVNKAAQTLFPEIKIGQSVSRVIRHPNLKFLIREVIDERNPEPIDYILHGPVERHFRITASELDNDPGADTETGTRVILVLYDTTDIERANTLRGEFLANASHELKTPVASLLGYIETLNGHAKDDAEARDRFLGIMQQQAERMQRLIDDLLSLRKIEQIEHIAPTETGDLFLAARAAAEAVAPMAQNRKIKTKYYGPKSLPVIGQQDELVQMVLNIIDNAVRMSPPGSRVTLTGSTLENWQAGDGFPDEKIAPDASRRRIINPPTAGETYAVLRICDEGPGFKSEHLPRLTERFYRIVGDRSSQDRGTGLGLAIVKHITLRHRGGLLIETAEGVGTEFTLILPYAMPEKGEDET